MWQVAQPGTNSGIAKLIPARAVFKSSGSLPEAGALTSCQRVGMRLAPKTVMRAWPYVESHQSPVVVRSIGRDRRHGRQPRSGLGGRASRSAPTDHPDRQADARLV